MLRCFECGKTFSQSRSLFLCPECGSELLEDSHAYLPLRIVGGKIQQDGFLVVSRDTKENIPWDRIRLICLGIVEEPALLHPSNFYLQLKGAVKSLFSREKKEEKPPVRQTLLLELFVAGNEKPLRFESTSINYRSFIEEVEYISEKNFRKFIQKLIAHLSNCVLDESLRSFLSNRKSNIRKFGNIYEFQRECQERWQKEIGEKTK